MPKWLSICSERWRRWAVSVSMVARYGTGRGSIPRTGAKGAGVDGLSVYGV